MKKGLFLCLWTLSCFTYELQANEITSVEFFQKGEVSHFEVFLKEEAIAERVHIIEDKQIILDIKDVKASKRVLRGIDTSEFSGSIAYISGYQKPGSKKDIRFAIQLRDNARSKFSKKGNKLILMVENRFGVFSTKERNKKEAGEKISQKTSPAPMKGLEVESGSFVEDVNEILTNLTSSGRKKFIGRRISLNVQNMKMNELLKIIAETSGFNIIIDSEVYNVPPVTLSLTEIPWDQVLNIVMSLGKLVATKHGSILQISTLEKIRAEQKKELDNKDTAVKLEPLVTKMFPISFANLQEMENILKEYLSPERGRITRDERTNTLIVKDTLAVMERLKKIIEVLDTQTPQVLIESKIVEASEDYSKRIGLSQGLTFGYDPVSTPGASTGPGFTFNTAPTPETAGVIGFSIGVYKRLQNLDLSLQLMENESKVRIVSSPKVITQNKQEAKIVSTDSTSYRVTNGQAQFTTGTANSSAGIQGGDEALSQGLAGFEQIDATLQLTVTPQVTNEGSISMKVDITKEGFRNRPFPDAPPDTTSRQVSTNVLVDNGSTIVIGGLYTSTTSESVSGVPILKDIPLIGWLFRTPYNPENSRSELIIFLTPRIINQEEAGLVNRLEGIGS